MKANGNRSAGTGKSLRLYAALQSLALAFCWLWFAVLGLIAISLYDIDNVEFWLLFASACAGLYGLRPNLERAIDRYWLGSNPTPASAAETIATLKPVKRRIDVVFSIIILVLLLGSLVLWSLRFFQSIWTVNS